MGDEQVNTPPVEQPQAPVQEVPVEAPVEAPVQPQLQPPQGLDERIDRRVNDTLRTFLSMVQTFGIHSLIWMQFVWNMLNQISSATQTVTTSVVRSFQPHLYAFFRDSAYPYRVQDYALSGIGVPPVEWYYDADKKVFLSANAFARTTEYETHHFEWLSGQIKYNNLLLHDISDYLQQARWAGASRPSAPVILSAWSLHSGTVLHLSDELKLHTINQDASESVLAVRG